MLVLLQSQGMNLLFVFGVLHVKLFHDRVEQESLEGVMAYPYHHEQ